MLRVNDKKQTQEGGICLQLQGFQRWKIAFIFCMTSKCVNDVTYLQDYVMFDLTNWHSFEN